MKKIMIVLVAASLSFAAQAQNEGHNLSIGAGCGLHQLNYSFDNAKVKNNVGFTINAGYSYFFTPNWGVSVGVGLQSFKNKLTLNQYTAVPAVDSENDAYELRTRITDWQEEQSVMLIDIPVMLSFKQELSQSISLLASVGGKISVPSKSTYKTKGGSITTTGYYSQWDVELSDIPEQGFMTYTSNESGDLKLKTGVSVVADLGLSFSVTPSISLFTVAYGSYGLNNIQKPEKVNTELLNGVSSKINVLAPISPKIEEMKPYSVGLRIGVTWNLSGSSARHGYHR